jgi:hypothetical protein
MGPQPAKARRATTEPTHTPYSHATMSLSIIIIAGVAIGVIMAIRRRR